VIGERLRHQPVQFAGSRVTLNLTISVGPILLHQALAQLRELVRGELDNLLFQLFDASHDVSTAKYTTASTARAAQN
jgi:hypothetical protein